MMAHGNAVFGLEARGFDHIPEAERNMTLRQVGPMLTILSPTIFHIVPSKQPTWFSALKLILQALGPPKPFLVASNAAMNLSRVRSLPARLSASMIV